MLSAILTNYRGIEIELIQEADSTWTAEFELMNEDFTTQAIDAPSAVFNARFEIDGILDSWQPISDESEKPNPSEKELDRMYRQELLGRKTLPEPELIRMGSVYKVILDEVEIGRIFTAYPDDVFNVWWTNDKVQKERMANYADLSLPQFWNEQKDAVTDLVNRYLTELQ